MSIIDALKKIFSEKQISSDPDQLEIYGKDWTTYFKPNATAVFFPETTEDVIRMVDFARQNSVALVPSGGRTGLSGGAVARNLEIVVSFDRMNKILEFNEIDQLVRVQAGVVTKELQNFVSEKGYLFPVEFGATGSSQIGGNIATNAGGIHVVRYGNTRNWISGLEVVTGKGERLCLNEGLVKNATGYDLRHLFIGSEGTLGFITEAQIRVTRKPDNSFVVLLATDSWEKILKIFSTARKSLQLNAFEVFTDRCLQAVLEVDHELQNPFSTTYPLYAIVEIDSEGQKIDPWVDALFQDELALDGTQADGESQKAALWKYRENITESIAPQRPYKNDISVLPSRIPEFVSKMTTILETQYQGFQVLWFGHIGDGNLHINILRPASMETDEFVQLCRKVDQSLFQCIQDLKGSISAEHGVGLTKKDFLSYSRSESEIESMKAIKKIFDPDLILNPGKIFDYKI